MNVSPFKHPSAWIPVVMSLTALGIVLYVLLLFGVPHETDEGTAAHLWQLLMAGQIPVIAYFAIRWLPQAPRQGLVVLALQAVAAISACAPVYYFKL